MSDPATLIFFCGKMAAGKSTLARRLAEERQALLLVQDEFLERLFPGDITDVTSYVRYSTRVWNVVLPLTCSVLMRGVSVVLDFPANTKKQRAWFRQIIDRAQVGHELHFIEASDATCKRRLRERSRTLPEGSPWTSEAEFDAVTAYFQPPDDNEGFNLIRHTRANDS